MNFFRSKPVSSRASSASRPNFENGALNQAYANQECAICFDSLTNGQTCNLTNSSNKQVCRHSFHTECVADLRHKLCPLCRTPYVNLAPVPSVMVDPVLWFAALDTDGDGALSYEEIVEGLKAQLPLDWTRVEADVDKVRIFSIVDIAESTLPAQTKPF